MKTCKTCGTSNLKWKESRSQPGNSKIWILVDEAGIQHTCKIHSYPVELNPEFFKPNFKLSI